MKFDRHNRLFSTNHGFDVRGSRPIDVVFDLRGSMYVLDFTKSVTDKPGEFIPCTGVIWKITKR